jgi:sec-independent protein translocase protein TatA
MIDGIGPMQFVVVLVVVLLLFGGRIPEVMRSVGSGLKEFKKGLANQEETSAESEPGGSRSE